MWINNTHARWKVIYQNNFEVDADKSFSQNVSDLILKILLPLVNENHFMCYL